MPKQSAFGISKAGFVGELCREMAKNPHVMTFSEAGKAATTGAVTARFAGVGPVGIAVGAIGNVAVVATEKGWDAAQELMSSKSSDVPRPK